MNRFPIIYRDMYFNIVYDVETLVEYAVSVGERNKGTMTMLVDSDGKPLLYNNNKTSKA